MSWEVTVDLGHLWTPGGQETPTVEGCGGEGGEEGKGGETWDEIIHQLTARSVIRDFEKMAEKDSDCGQGETKLLQTFISRIRCLVHALSTSYCLLGSAKRYRMKAIQTSKHCNIICMYTAFAATNNNPNKGLQDSMDVQNTGVPILSTVPDYGFRQPHVPVSICTLRVCVLCVFVRGLGMHLVNSQSSRSGSRRQRAYSVGLGRRHTGGDSKEMEDTWNSTGRPAD